MAAWSLALQSHRGRHNLLRRGTRQIGGITNFLVAPAGLISRSQSLRSDEVARCNSLAKNPARPREYLAAEISSSDGRRQEALKLRFSDNPDPRRPAGYERSLTPETVIKLCQQGQLGEAVEVLGILVQTESHISKTLFYAVLKKCVAKKDLVMGRRVHTLTANMGYETDTFLCNHILRMYAAHGRLQEAMDVFALIAKPDAFTWSSIISAHVRHRQAKQAIKLYHQMRRSNVKPDGHVFVAALKACASGADLKTGQLVHADVLDSGIEPDLFVCSCLVDMYAKCGSLKDAESVFDGLHAKDVVTWNTMIAGYAQQGMGQEALRLYYRMQQESVCRPDSVTFVCLLQACASVGVTAIEKGKQLHAHIEERGLRDDVVVGCSLVNMYAKCGSLRDAQTVFDGLSQKDVVTWNAMIAGYAQHGMGQEALCLYGDMQQEGVSAPTSVTFVCLLQACASVGALHPGRQLHAQIEKQGLQADVFIANSLINMYAKCGSLGDAHTVFEGLCRKTVVTWNAMIAGYAQQGMGQQAFSLYDRMQQEGSTAPDCVTFVCLLQACASMGIPAMEKGKQLQAQIEQRGLQADVVIGCSLVNMYAKCGCIGDAESVFTGLRQKDVVTWNAMIAGYVQQGMVQEALSLYDRMQQDGTSAPDAVTFVCLLQACASVGVTAVEKGKHLHAQIEQRGLQEDVVIGCSLVNMYAKCGSLKDAESVFDRLCQKYVVMWNSMMAGYSQQGMGQKALRLYSAMQQEGVAAPDSVTFVCLLHACASVGVTALQNGKQLHAQIEEQGFQAVVAIGNSLVNMYAKCGSLEDARRVFDGLCQKDVVTWNTMIAGYVQQGMGPEAHRLYNRMQQDGGSAPDSVTFLCLLQACASVGVTAVENGKQLHAQIEERGLQAVVTVGNSLVNMYSKCGSLEDAQSVFDGLRQKNVVTWNAMIAGYAQQGMGQEALSLYNRMRQEGISAPDSVTFVCLLQACASALALHSGRQLHAQIEEQGLQADVFVANSLINMYAKSGSMIDAQQVFDALPERDIVAWNALIAGYARQGDSEVVFDLVHQMTEDCVQPNDITFLSVLTVCSHAGLVSKGQEYFKVMSRHYDITATVEHYTCMVDLMGRAGQLEEALAMVRTMPVQAQVAVWHTLLCACQKWNNVEVGRHAFNEAVKLDRRDASAYVMMSNIYTSVQMWEEAHEMQAKRKRMGAWKEPGQSWWTDTGGIVHAFVVGRKAT